MKQCLINYTGTTGASELRTCATPFWVGPASHCWARKAHPHGIHPDQRTAADWMAAIVPIDQPPESLASTARTAWLDGTVDEDDVGESDGEGEGSGPSASRSTTTGTKAQDDFRRYAAPVVPRTPLNIFLNKNSWMSGVVTSSSRKRREGSDPLHFSERSTECIHGPDASTSTNGRRECLSIESTMPKQMGGRFHMA